MFEKLIGFINRVRAAVTAGVKLKKEDIEMLMDILEKFMEREKIYTYAILSLLGKSNPSKKELEKFEKIVNRATERIIKREEPFTKDEVEGIKSFFKSIGLNEKSAMKFVYEFTALRGKMMAEVAKETMTSKEKEAKKEREKVA